MTWQSRVSHVVDDLSKDRRHYAQGRETAILGLGGPHVRQARPHRFAPWCVFGVGRLTGLPHLQSIGKVNQGLSPCSRHHDYLAWNICMRCSEVQQMLHEKQ